MKLVFLKQFFMFYLTLARCPLFHVLVEVFLYKFSSFSLLMFNVCVFLGSYSLAVYSSNFQV